MIRKLFIPLIYIQFCLCGQLFAYYGSGPLSGHDVENHNYAAVSQIGALSGGHQLNMGNSNPVVLASVNERTIRNEEAFFGTTWWNSLWACLIYLFILAIAIIAIVRYDRRKNRLICGLKLKELEADRLKHLDQLKMKYFTHVSEEFRTPLTLILGHVDYLLEKNWPEKDQQKLKRVLFRSKQLLFLVNQMLDLSKLDTGSMKLQLTEHNIISFLKNITSTYEVIAAKKDITLRFNAFYSGLSMYFDTEKLEKILGNLLSNAIKFTPKGGMVTVLTRMVTSIPQIDDRIGKPPYVEILVQDSGMGILAEDLEHLFDRFYQKNGAYTGHKGSGVGLSLIKDFVELHHGIITVESTVGLGTTFTCWLPVDHTIYGEDDFAPKTARRTVISDFEMTTLEDLPPAENDALTLGSPVTSDGDDHKKLILVVDNNPDMREYIGEHLETNGYRIDYAIDGETGLHKSRETIPDLIISDVMLPNLDGFLFCQMIRQDERTSHIPLIMLTTEASFESRIEGLESGADDYITKPFSSKELLIRVANLIKIRSKLQNHTQQTLTIQLSKTDVESMDQKFLNKVLSCIETHMEDETFTVDQLGQEVGMSVNHLNRKLKALLGQTVGHFIRSIRLKRAADLLVNNAATVSEIAYQLGFNDPANFTRSFKREFGCSPVQYQEKSKVNGNAIAEEVRNQLDNSDG